MLPSLHELQISRFFHSFSLPSILPFSFSPSFLKAAISINFIFSREVLVPSRIFPCFPQGSLYTPPLFESPPESSPPSSPSLRVEHMPGFHRTCPLTGLIVADFSTRPGRLSIPPTPQQPPYPPRPPTLYLFGVLLSYFACFVRFLVPSSSTTAKNPSLSLSSYAPLDSPWGAASRY